MSVAVLIDNFISATVEMETAKAEAEEAIVKRKEQVLKAPVSVCSLRIWTIGSPMQVQNTLDPLLEELTRAYVDDHDLILRLRTLFEVCAQVNDLANLVKNWTRMKMHDCPFAAASYTFMAVVP